MTVGEILRALAFGGLLCAGAFRAGQCFQTDRILGYLESVEWKCKELGDDADMLIAAVVKAAVEGIAGLF